MAREDWRDREDPRVRSYREDLRDRADFGQADYSESYAYDPERRAGYRVGSFYADKPDDYRQADRTRDVAYERDARLGDRREPRSWVERAEAFLGGRPRRDGVETRPPKVRRGPSDRVLWAVIVERLEDERSLDLRDVEVVVDDAEVTLNGTVRRKIDRRRIEDVADIDGVRHVQNNLRVRDRGHWTFI